MIWTDDSVPFLFSKHVSANCSRCPLFPFQQAQYAQVSPLKPAPFYKLFAGLGSTNKSAISIHPLSDSRSVLATLSSVPSFLLLQFLWQNWQELSFLSCTIKLQWVPRHSCLPGNDVADKLAGLEAVLIPPTISCSLSPLIPRIHSSFFLGLEAYCLIEILTHRFPRFPPRNLCSLVIFAVFSLSSLQRTQPSVKLLSLYDWQNREFFLQIPPVPGHLSSHSSLSSYGLFAPLAL